MFKLQRYIQVLLMQLMLDELAGSSEMVESSGTSLDSSTNTTPAAGPGAGAGPITPQDVTDGQLGDIPPRKPE